MAEVRLGHLIFERCIDSQRSESVCFLSRNFFCDEGPLKVEPTGVVEEYNEPSHEEPQEEGAESDDDDKEGVVIVQQAKRKYEVFQRTYQDMLDPNLESEFEMMRGMGLPTMLINSYDDIEEDQDYGCSSRKDSRKKKRKATCDVMYSYEEERSPVVQEEHSVIEQEEEHPLVLAEQEEKEEEHPQVEEEDMASLLMEYRVESQEASSDSESSVHSVTGAIDETQFNIDWDEVREGKAAGLPSQWETVAILQDEEETEDKSLPAEVEDELYHALRMKAMAYADQSWQEYWSVNGPGYLASCWKSQHPEISLRHVEIVSGLGFLCDSLEKKMQLETQLKGEDGVEKEESAVTVSDEEVLRLWNDFYNSLYWYTFNLFQLNFSDTSGCGLMGTCDSHMTENTVDEDEQEYSQKQMSASLQVKSPVDQLLRTKQQVQGLGFSIGSEVGINPHERKFRNLKLKLQRFLNKGQKVAGINHGFVNRSGQLILRRDYGGGAKRSTRKKSKSKKKKTKTKPAETEDCTVIDDSTGQAEPYTAGTGSYTAGTESYTTGTGSYTAGTEPYTAGTGSYTAETEPYTAGTGSYTAGTTAETEPYTSGTDSNTAVSVIEAQSNTAQTESHAIETDTQATTQTESYAIETDTQATTQNESEEQMTEDDTADHSDDDELLPEPDIATVAADVQVESLAGQAVSISNYLPPLLSISSDHHLTKYWTQRFRLFSLYNEGIRMDQEGWFSASPEKIAVQIAERCQCDLLVDAFCGVGSNAIQFAFTCERVIAIDIDPVKLACARHNAQIYGVADRIEFILGDYFDIMPQLTCADVVFISPPWGGPNYLSAEVFDLETMVSLNGVKVFEVARAVTPHIAYYLPRNIGIDQLVGMVPAGEPIELEQQFMNRKLKTITAYFGELVNP